MIEERLADQHDGDEGELLPVAPTRYIDMEHRGKQDALKEHLIQQYVHGRHHTDQADEVEPGGSPSPGFATQMGAPVIQAACGREGRTNLSHAKGDAHGNHPANEPNEEGAASAASIERCREG